MANKEINQLPAVQAIGDDDLFVLEQNGVASKLTGEQLVDFVETTATPFVTRAETAATNAEGYATTATTKAGEAATSATNAGNSATAAAASATSADTDADRAENARDEVEGMADLFPRKHAENDPANSSFNVVFSDAAKGPVLGGVFKGKTVAYNRGSSGSPYAYSMAASGVQGLNITATIKDHIYYCYFKKDTEDGVRTSAAGIIPYISPSDLYAGKEYITTAASTASQVMSLINNSSTTAASGNLVAVPIDLTLVFSSEEVTAIGTDVAKFKAAWLKKYGTPFSVDVPYSAGELFSNNAKYQLTGKNLCGNFFPQGTYGATITKIGDTYTLEKAGGGGAFIDRPIKNGQKYTLSFTIKSGTVTNCRIYSDTNTPTDATRVQDLSNSGGSFTAVGDGYIRFWFSGTLVLENVQLELGETATTYEPYYNGGSVDLSAIGLNGFDGTDVYDTYNSVTGKLGRKTVILTLGDYTWTFTANRFVVSCATLGIKTNTRNAILSTGKYTYQTGGTDDMTFYIGATNLAFHDNSITSAADFKQAMIDGNVKLCVELATPTEESVAAQPMETQAGYNLLQPISGDLQSGYVGIDYPIGLSYIKPASEDGLYMVEQDGEELSLVAQPMDNAPTAGSTKPVTSQGIKAAIEQAVWDMLPVDTATGSVASFPDGANNVPVKDLLLAINPVQNLNGYDNPWPAGGGKNKLDVSTLGLYDVTGTGTERYGFGPVTLAAGTYTLSKASGSNSFYITNKTDSYSNTSVSEWPFTFTLAAESEILVRTTLGNADISMYDTTNVQLESGSSATSFAPYSNVCPITGFTGVNISRTGINIWDEEWENGEYDLTNGTTKASVNAIRNKNHIPVLPQTTYYLKAPAANSLVKVLCRDRSGAYLSYKNTGNDVFTTPSNCYLIDFCVGGSVLPVPTYPNDISINYPSTDTSYHSGTDNAVIPIDWTSTAGTVYGGTLDVTTGVLTVDSVHQTYDETNDWKKSSSYAYFYLSITPYYKAAVGLSNISNQLVYAGQDVNGQFTLTTPNSFGLYNRTSPETRELYVYIPTITTVEDLKTYFSQNPLDVVLKLATPVTYQLTPTQVATLLGTNNVWHNANGNTTVEYRADIQKYIAKMIAEA